VIGCCVVYIINDSFNWFVVYVVVVVVRGLLWWCWFIVIVFGVWFVDLFGGVCVVRTYGVCWRSVVIFVNGLCRCCILWIFYVLCYYLWC